jgi:hypothetical protein
MLKRVRAKTDESVVQLRSHREAERLRLVELEARSRSRLETLLPQLEADPILAGAVELLKPSQAADGASRVAQSS